MKIKLITSLVLLAIVCLSVGFKVANDSGFKYCKEVGWEFIDELFEPVPEKYRSTEAVKRQYTLMRLGIENKCRVRFNK